MRASRRRAGTQHRPRRLDPGPTRRPGRHRQPVLLVVVDDHPHGRARDRGGRGRCLSLGRSRMRVAVRQRLPRRPRHLQPAPGAREHRGISRHLHHDGRDGRERRRAREDQPRGAGPLRRQEPGCRGQSPRRRLLRPRDHPGPAPQRRDVRQGRQPPAGHDGRGAGDPEAGVPRERHCHRRQRLPAQRRRRRRRGHVRAQGEGARHQAARARRLDRPDCTGA